MITNLFIPILWFTAIALQLAQAYVCYRGSIGKRRPAFATFIYFQNASCIFAACVYPLAAGVPTMLYYWTYYASIGLTAALTLLVAFECGKHTFGPRIALPGWVPNRIATMVASAVALVIALNLLFAATNGGSLTRAMVTTEQGLTVTVLAIFLIIISYSRRLGITGNPRTQKIMFGFVLYLSVSVLAVFVRGSARPSAAIAAKALGMGAYCVSLLYWTVVLWTKEQLPERLTVQQAQDLTTAFMRLRERAASMGITPTH